MVRIGSIVLYLFFFSPALAQAYSLSDHRFLTQAALTEFQRCSHQSISSELSLEIYRGNFGEDVNLYRKWFSYSHYYHPEKKLDMWRWSSADRILNIEQTLQDSFKHSTNEESLYFLLGQALHHLQDMASPPHVVPVNHDMNDGFEDYFVSLMNEFSLSESDPCHFLTLSNDSDSPHKMHHDRAQKTLSYVRNNFFPAQANSVGMSIAWSAFWKESNDGSFGVYGYLGNEFGSQRILLNEFVYEINEKVFQDFKITLMRDAIESSKMALDWFYKERRK
ncbi:MAG: hypothetical protein HYS98_08410 [Deltaproteobacteria bacterium]|nr:hypothetical protein [Deltaproteobacteria bacterium]